ncbi:putative ribosome-binding factor A, mitochondrial [Galemys pyrenaicus]|uniref:Putative ribosome-binding factor A, mitochondrial n=1 Tax=Galemys pyrenaicus TaxID=202257 RepID=A0A8J6DCX3_GALPY|nr:putative ribosome-binding factor A, mitochondrial [Galemys pyrenaicus]
MLHATLPVCDRDSARLPGRVSSTCWEPADPGLGPTHGLVTHGGGGGQVASACHLGGGGLEPFPVDPRTVRYSEGGGLASLWARRGAFSGTCARRPARRAAGCWTLGSEPAGGAVTLTGAVAAPPPGGLRASSSARTSPRPRHRPSPFSRLRTHVAPPTSPRTLVLRPTSARAHVARHASRALGFRAVMWAAARGLWGPRAGPAAVLGGRLARPPPVRARGLHVSPTPCGKNLLKKFASKTKYCARGGAAGSRFWGGAGRAGAGRALPGLSRAARGSWTATPRPPPLPGLLQGSHQKTRRGDHVRLRALNGLLHKALTELLCTPGVSPELCDGDVLLSKVSLAADFSACRVYWSSTRPAGHHASTGAALQRSAPQIRTLDGGCVPAMPGGNVVPALADGPGIRSQEQREPAALGRRLAVLAVTDVAKIFAKVVIPGRCRPRAKPLGPRGRGTRAFLDALAELVPAPPLPLLAPSAMASALPRHLLASLQILRNVPPIVFVQDRGSAAQAQVQVLVPRCLQSVGGREAVGHVEWGEAGATALFWDLRCGPSCLGTVLAWLLTPVGRVALGSVLSTPVAGARHRARLSLVGQVGPAGWGGADRAACTGFTLAVAETLRGLGEESSPCCRGTGQGDLGAAGAAVQLCAEARGSRPEPHTPVVVVKLPERALLSGDVCGTRSLVSVRGLPLPLQPITVVLGVSVLCCPHCLSPARRPTAPRFCTGHAGPRPGVDHLLQAADFGPPGGNGDAPRDFSWAGRCSGWSLLLGEPPEAGGEAALLAPRDAEAPRLRGAGGAPACPGVSGLDHEALSQQVLAYKRRKGSGRRQALEPAGSPTPQVPRRERSPAGVDADQSPGRLGGPPEQGPTLPG